MSRSLSSRFALPFLYMLACLASATSVGVAGQQPAAGQPSPNQTFGASATAVVVDVVVRDKGGKPVTDLTAADFQLLEDGQPQTIGSMTLVAPQPAALAAGGLPVPPAGAPTAASAAVAAPTFVALVFDRLSPEARALAWKAATAYLDTARDNDFAGVFVVSNALEMVQTYTTDRVALKKAIDDAASRATANYSKDANRPFQGQPDRSPTTSMTASAEESGPLGGATPTNPGGVLPVPPAAGPGSPVNVADRFEAALARVVSRTEATYETMMREEQGYATTNGLLAVVDALSLLPGRKTVVFFAEGLAIPPAVLARFDSVVATANRANVSVYTIDAAGLRVHSTQAETAAGVTALGNTTFDRDSNAPPPGARPLMEGLESNEDNLRRDPG